jgi:hypothetical protein
LSVVPTQKVRPDMLLDMGEREREEKREREKLQNPKL